MVGEVVLPIELDAYKVSEFGPNNCEVRNEVMKVDTINGLFQFDAGFDLGPHVSVVIYSVVKNSDYALKVPDCGMLKIWGKISPFARGTENRLVFLLGL